MTMRLFATLIANGLEHRQQKLASLFQGPTLAQRLLALMPLLLAACSNTPLPPWPSSASVPRATVPARTPRSQAMSVPLPLGQDRTGATTQPLPRGASLAMLNEAPLKPPYGPAVAMRFPDPPIQYNTPGLAPNRRVFTTNAEISQWLHRLAENATLGNTRSSILTLGTSQRGEDILALLLTHAKGVDPANLAAGGRPTVVLIGQQHGNEPAGAEALLVIASELAQGLLEPLLDRINVVILPRANPDGAAAGVAATASGVDMDHDHLLLTTPESQALARLVRDYRPILVAEAQEYPLNSDYLQKFHAMERYDALLQYGTPANYPEFLTKASQEWYHQPMVDALKGQNLSSEWYHALSADPADKSLSTGNTQPDTSRNVQALKNAVSLVIATRGAELGRLHIQRRVHTHVTALTSALRSTSERAANLEQVRSFVVRDTSALACRDQAVLQTAATPTQRELLMLEPETGADRSVRVQWNSSLAARPLKSRARPCGYWLDVTAVDAIEKLKLWGVQVLNVGEAGSLLAETYRETSREKAMGQTIAATNAGIQVQVSTVRTAIDAQPSSFYIPLNQPLANLVIAILEPDTPNSYFANGLLDDLSKSARVMATPSLVFEEGE